MAQSEAQAVGLSTSQALARSDWGERLLRRTSAWIMLLFLLQGELGAVWDREWHYYVGRDQFWTPPHTLIYSCVAGAGIVALIVVLLDTLRYRRGTPGVDDSSTVRIFGVFHAPLGFIIGGFGAFQALVSGPLDNYWHNLYGIDIALWAPFHMMGVTGAVIGNLGMIYVFASEAAIERESGQPYRRYLGFSLLEWGTLVLIAGLMHFTLIGFLQFPIVEIGLLHIPSYGLPMAGCGALGLIAAVRLTHKVGAATVTVLILVLHTTIAASFVPWAINFAVAQQGLFYNPRHLGEIPFFEWTRALLPMLYIVSALSIDGVTLWRLRHGKSWANHMRGLWLLGAIITIPELLLAPLLIIGTLDLPGAFLAEKMGQVIISIPSDLRLEALLIAVPVILAFGAFGALLGGNFGDIWRWSKR